MRALRRSLKFLLTSSVVTVMFSLPSLASMEKMPPYVSTFMELSDTSYPDLKEAEKIFSEVVDGALNTGDPEKIKTASDSLLSLAENAKNITIRYLVAQALTKLDTKKAAQAHHFIASGQKVNVDNHINAAQHLAVLGEPYKQEAAKILLSIAGDKKLEVYNRINAAQNLADLDNTYKQEAANILLSIAGDKKLEAYNRINAAQHLAALGKPYQQEAANAFLSIARDEKLYTSDRLNAAQALAAFGDPYQQEAVNAYFSIGRDEKLYASYRINAAQYLADLDNTYKQEAAKILLSIAGDEKLELHHCINAAQHLAALGEPYQQEAAHFYTSIAGDEKLETYYRIDAAKNLAQLGEAYKQEAAQAYRFIVRDEKVPSNHRISGAQALAKLGEAYKPEAAQAYLSIAKDETVDDDTRFSAADLLTDLGEIYKQEAAQAHHFIASDQKVDAYTRLSQAQSLARLGESYKQEAAHFYIFLAGDEKLDVQARLQAARDLTDLDDTYKQEAAQFYTFLAGDEKVNANHRIKAAQALSELGEPYKQEAANFYLAIARDQNLDPASCVQAANALLSFDEQKDTAIGILNGLLSDPTHSKTAAKEIMKLVGRGLFALDNQHKVVHQALTLSPEMDENHPIEIYQFLVEKIKSPVTIEFPQEIVGEKTVTFTQKAFAPKVIPLSIPHADHEMVKKFFEDFSQELKNPKAMDQFKVANECILHGSTGELQFSTPHVAFSTFNNLVKGVFFQNNLKGRTIPAEAFKDSLVVKLHCLVHYLSTLDGAPKPDGLSERSAHLINFFAQTSSCMSGKKSGVDQMYQDLPAAYKIAIGSTDETEIYALEQAARLNIIKEGLMKTILPSNNIIEPTHQKNYLYALLGQRIGLYEGESIPFDIYGQVVHQKLRDLSLQDALTAFFEFYTPQGMVDRTKAYFNTKLTEEDKQSQYKTTTFLFNTFCSDENDETEKYKTCFSWKEDETLGTDKIIAIIHPSITVKILSQLGFLTEVKDDMDRDGDSKETSSKKRKRKEGDGSHEHEPVQKKARPTPPECAGGQ